MKCNICWCNTNSWKGLGCSLHANSRKMMPCGFHEELIYIFVAKKKAHEMLIKVIHEIEESVDIPMCGIDESAKEIVSLLRDAESKMTEYISKYQDAINKTMEERKRG